MKILVQSDDYGFTRGVTLATYDAINRGLITCTGLFANMPSARDAVDLVRGNERLCLGIDINIVSGRPCSDEREIPHLIDAATGEFVSSQRLRANPDWGKTDPYPYDEVYVEAKSQIERFVGLTEGRLPEYIHGHSIGEASANYRQALHDLGKEYGIPFTRDVYARFGVVRLQGNGKKPFPLEEQAECDSEKKCLEQLEAHCHEEYVRIGGHCGYVDNDLLRYSTFTVVRAKDYVMYTSDKIKAWIEQHDAELISYRDLK